jgi:hypothetical protein
MMIKYIYRKRDQEADEPPIWYQYKHKRTTSLKTNLIFFELSTSHKRWPSIDSIPLT